MKASDLTWIDDFFREITPYIHVRKEDSLLILIPNQAHQLNPTGLRLLSGLKDGKTIGELLEATPGDEKTLDEIHYFFCDIRAAVMGCLREDSGRLGVEEIDFTPPLNTLPVLSELAVTYRCNLSCRFCYAGDHVSRYPELDTESLQRILDIIYHDAQVPSTSFTGGEPTLREDLESLVSHAVTIGMRTNLITNATLLDEDRVKRLKDAGLSSAQASLEASTPSLHDRIVGKEGAFERTLRGIDLLRKHGIKTHTNTTLNAMNAGDATSGFVSFIRSLGMDRFSMNLMIPCGTAIPHLEELRLTYSRIPEIIHVIKKRARKEGIRFMWYSPIPYCMLNPIAEGLGNKSCAACDGLLSVAPDGSVLPCSSYNEPVGNLLSRPFREIWNGKKACYFKEKRFVPEPCRECGLREICTGACPLYWKVEGVEELERLQLHDSRNDVTTGDYGNRERKLSGPV